MLILIIFRTNENVLPEVYHSDNPVRCSLAPSPGIHLVPFYVPVMIRKDLRVQEWCPFDHKIGLDNHFSVIFVTICDHF